MNSSDKQQLSEQVAAAVQQRLGRNDSTIAQMVSQELATLLGDAKHEQRNSNPSRVVVTAHGRNRIGVVARLATAITEFEGDIQDLSQTIVGDYFTMLFVIDLSGVSAESARFSQLRHHLKQVADDMGVHVVAIHDDILSAMHHI